MADDRRTWAVAIYLGRQVKITIGAKMVVKGKLLAIGEYGEFVIEGEDGEISYCWPMLRMELDEHWSTKETVIVDGS